jgi:hypothetical protein
MGLSVLRVGVVAPGAQHLHLLDQACVLASANQMLSPSRKAPRIQFLAPRLSVSHVLIGSHSERSTRRDLSIIYKTPVGQNMPQRVLHSHAKRLTLYCTSVRETGLLVMFVAV